MIRIGVYPAGRFSNAPSLAFEDDLCYWCVPFTTLSNTEVYPVGMLFWEIVSTVERCSQVSLGRCRCRSLFGFRHVTPSGLWSYDRVFITMNEHNNLPRGSLLTINSYSAVWTECSGVLWSSSSRIVSSVWELEPDWSRSKQSIPLSSSGTYSRTSFLASSCNYSVGLIVMHCLIDSFML